MSGKGIRKIKEGDYTQNTRKCLSLPYSKTWHTGQKPSCWGLHTSVGERRHHGRAAGSPGQKGNGKAAGAQSRSAGYVRIKGGGWKDRWRPRAAPQLGRPESPAPGLPPKSEPGRSGASRSRFLPRGSACRGQTSQPGSQHSPPPSPQPNIPANSGRWPAPPAPAPTPSSLRLLPSADAATAAPRAAASPQPRRPISPPLPPGSRSGIVQAAAGGERTGEPGA